MLRYGDVAPLALLFSLARLAFMGYAAWRDARTRTFPNCLAVVLVTVCAIEAVLNGGLTDLAVPDGMGGLQDGGFIAASGLQALVKNAIAANVVFALLYVFELVWRHFRREPGLGMGDLKFLFALMIAEPFKALMSFIIGLIALAFAGAITRKSSFPLLPFMVGAYFTILLVGFLVTFGM